MIYIQQSNDPDKYLTMEMLEFHEPIEAVSASHVKFQYRFGYYMQSKKGGARLGQWVWGQYCPIMPL